MRSKIAKENISKLILISKAAVTTLKELSLCGSTGDGKIYRNFFMDAISILTKGANDDQGNPTAKPKRRNRVSKKVQKK